MCKDFDGRIINTLHLLLYHTMQSYSVGVLIMCFKKAYIVYAKHYIKYIAAFYHLSCVLQWFLRLCHVIGYIANGIVQHNLIRITTKLTSQIVITFRTHGRKYIHTVILRGFLTQILEDQASSIT